jgi:hypothetical protein
MGDPPPYPDSDDERGARRWVRVLVAVALVVALLIVALMAIGIGGGEHGPGRHARSGGGGGQRAPFVVVMEDHTPTAGARG